MTVGRKEKRRKVSERRRRRRRRRKATSTPLYVKCTVFGHGKMRSYLLSSSRFFGV
jgi:ribosomal protein L32